MEAGGGERGCFKDSLPAGNGRVLHRSVIIIFFSLGLVEVGLKVIASGNIYVYFSPLHALAITNFLPLTLSAL